MAKSLALFLLTALVGCTPLDEQRALVRQSGHELLLRIDAAFGLENGLYASELRGGKPTGVARCWPAAVQLFAIAQAAEVDRFWRGRLNAYVAALDAHWSESSGIGGYDASPNPRTPDRYYDDNAWMALALIQAYGLTRDPEHLRRARDAMRFVLSGEDLQLGGGIWWHEQTRQTKNACSTAPAIVACLRLHRITGEAGYKSAAERLHKWMNATMRDTDALYFDRLDLSASIEPTKFSYNSAVMVIADCEWFDLTEDPAYLDHARQTAAAGVRYWVAPTTGAIRDDAPFAGLFAEALLQLYRRDGERRWREIALLAIAEARTNNLDPAGWHPVKWDARPRAPLETVRFADQSAAARAMLTADAIR